MTKKLIEKFFNNDCDEAEKQEVLSFLETDPLLFDDYLSENEWNNFIKKEKLDPKISKGIYRKINRHTQTKGRIVPLVKILAIAASIILITGIGWKYLLNQYTTREIAVHELKTKIVDTVNISNAIVEIILPDNSTVELAPGSRLKYLIPLSEKTRNVLLTGEAVFRVAKDSTRPFTVTSGEIATTALGTVFRVIALEHEPSIHVRLLEGKVVIRKNNDNQNQWKKDYYLSPGEEFKFDKNTNLATTFLFNNKKIKLNNTKIDNKKLQNISAQELSNWYMFDNQNLAEVFKNLESIYNVKIEFNHQSIRRMNFIGKIEKRDSIEMIIRDLARINGLTVNRVGNTFFIGAK